MSALFLREEKLQILGNKCQKNRDISEMNQIKNGGN
jgi:hypothetical protein